MSDAALRAFGPVFLEETRKALYEYLEQPGWESGWRSSSKNDAFSFLHKHFAGHRKASGPDYVYDCEEELSKSAPPIYLAWMGLKEKHFKDQMLVRCYANGMMYGMDGTVHTDTKKSNNYTFVYYPHERWSPNWGGETLFFNPQENGIIGCVYPRPNSAIMFDGRIPHRANGVTRLFPGMRITMMFKFQAVEPTNASV